MANNRLGIYQKWMEDAEKRISSVEKRASSARQVMDEFKKQAADQEALTGIKDPTDAGEVSIPGFGDGGNRAKQQLPTNSNNMGEPNKDHAILDVTKPNGVGQGTYVTPENGTAKDEAVKSPTVSIDKLAAKMREASNKINKLTQYNTQGQQHVSKEASQSFSLPSDFKSDTDLMSKLASIGALMLGTEHGYRAVKDVLEKQAGIEEARAIIAEAEQAIAHEAINLQNNSMTNQNYIAKMASAAQIAHEAWYNQFTDEFEKTAYVNGAEDGAAVAEAVAAGEDPTEMAGDISDEDIINYLQELVASGEVSQEEAEAVLQAIGEAAQDGLTGDELALALQQAVSSGQLDEEAATAIAQNYLAQMGGGDDAAAMAADTTEKTASVINSLFSPNQA